jgi:chromosome segregation ATPase
LASISASREEYYSILEQREAKEAELVTLIAENNKVRASEVAEDDRRAKEVADQAAWDESYTLAIESYQALGIRIVDIQEKIDDYTERQEQLDATSDKYQKDFDKYQLFLDLYEKQIENASEELITSEATYNDMQYQKVVRAE